MSFATAQLLAGLADEALLPQLLPGLTESLGRAGHGLLADKAVYAKVHTRISTLLQSKQPRLRWCAACLVEAIVRQHDTGRQTLASHGASWIKALLRNMETAKQVPLVMATLRAVLAILSACQGDAQLTRDIATPGLPGLFTTLLKLIDASSADSSLSHELLRRLLPLMRSYPTTFRPFAGRVQTYCLSQLNGSCRHAASLRLVARVFVTLHVCAAKNASAQEWLSGVQATIDEMHNVVSFIAAPTTLKSHAGSTTGLGMLPFSSEQYDTEVAGALARAEALASVLGAFLSSRSADTVAVPAGAMVRLVERMWSVNLTTGIRASTPRSTQTALVASLPPLHTVAFRLANTLCRVLEQQSAFCAESFTRVAVEHMARSLDVEALYLLRRVVSLHGLTPRDIEIEPLLALSAACLESTTATAPQFSTAAATSSKKRKAGTTAAADAPPAFTRPTAAVARAVCGTLRALFTHAPQHVSSKAQDRLAVAAVRIAMLSQDGELRPQAMSLLQAIACHGNPRPTTAALLSVLTTLSNGTGRAAHISEYLELMAHPRLPPLKRRALTFELDDDSDTGSEADESSMNGVLPPQTESLLDMPARSDAESNMVHTPAIAAPTIVDRPSRLTSPAMTEQPRTAMATSSVHAFDARTTATQDDITIAPPSDQLTAPATVAVPVPPAHALQPVEVPARANVGVKPPTVLALADADDDEEIADICMDSDTDDGEVSDS